jgi:hypothetical protein
MGDVTISRLTVDRRNGHILLMLAQPGADQRLILIADRGIEWMRCS